MQIKIYRAATYYSCIAALAEEIGRRGNSPDLDNVVFTEEKNTLITERAVVGKGGAFNTRVLSMRKFLRSLSGQCDLLSKQGSVMLLRRVIGELAPRLGTFGKLRFKALAPTVYELIAQLKSAKVTPEDLGGAAAQAGELLGGKLKDLALLYAGYDKAVNASGYKDQSNYLAELPKKIYDGALDRSDVFFSAYSSFTRQEADVVRAALGRAKSVTAFFVDGDNASLYTGEALRFFREIAGDCEVVDVAETGVSAGSLGRIFDPRVGGEKLAASVTEFVAADVEEEIARVAEIIKRAVMDGAIRYRDAQVEIPATSASAVRRVFADYGIPCFIDKKYTLSQHALARLALDYLGACRKNCERRRMLAFVKNPLVAPDAQFIDGYENYILACGVDRTAFLRPFRYRTGDEKFADYEAFRARLAPLFANPVKRASAKIFADTLYKMFADLEIDRHLEEQSRQLEEAGEAEQAAIGAQAMAHVRAVIDETVEILGDAEIDADEYEGLLSGGFAADEMAVLPQYADAVYVGDFKAIRLVKTKYLFLTGLTSDVPSARSDVAMLTDGDLDRLERLKVVVEPKIRTVNRRERENAGLAAASFSERLYLSYAATGTDGKSRAPSELIAWLRAIYTVGDLPAINDETHGYLTPRQAEKQFAADVFEFMCGRGGSVLPASCYAAFDEASKARADGILAAARGAIVMRLDRGRDIILRNKRLSASLLERYFACPYRNFLDNGLGLKERDVGEAQPFDVGNFLHAVLQEYAPMAKDMASDQESDEKVAQIVAKLIKDERYAVFAEKGAGRNLLERLEKEAAAFGRRVRRQYADSSFVSAGTEVVFGDGGKYGAIALPCASGTRYIEGKVDRVDEYGDYIRVIDYKTGSKEFKDAEFFIGRDLQLFLYMNAFSAYKKPGGVYYCKVNNAYCEADKRGEDLSGYTLNDSEVIEASDGSLRQADEAQSSIIRVKKGRTGYSGSLLTGEELDAYLKYALKIAAKAADEIADGVIAASPASGECEYCPYVGACAFKAAGAAARSVGSVSRKTVIDTVDDRAQEKSQETSGGGNETD